MRPPRRFNDVMPTQAPSAQIDDRQTRMARGSATSTLRYVKRIEAVRCDDPLLFTTNTGNFGWGCDDRRGFDGWALQEVSDVRHFLRLARPADCFARPRRHG
jgi:hypothetical protein